MKRLAYLDALRGIAALMVVFTHLYAPLIGHVWVFDYLIDPGKLGVLWFFMISGVVIPYSLKPGPEGARRFLISRLMRLYPAYWVSLLIFVIMLKLTGAPLPSLAQIVANLTMVQAALGFDDVIGLYWTLFIELVFYGLCLALFLGGKLYDQTVRARCSLGCLLLALAMGVVRAVSERKLPVALPLALSLMFFGSIWRQWLLAEHSKELTRNLSTLLIAFVLILPPTLIMAYSKDMGTGETWGRYCFTYTLAIGSFLLLTRSLRLNHPVLVWLGAVSYSLYLLHPSMLMLAEHVLGACVPEGNGAAPLSVALLATLLTLGAADLCFRCIESPFIQLGKRLNNRKAKAQTISV
ncbi:acyltransferase [Pseudomonas sp. LP_7_YM]|uniref:acyltransferase family protein n=1 Tax=Pseudomonas sp. LP_7_YM TaxID=2485137 RepID=UPI0010D5D402|nr:acyltransferase [Pseudomonas sp. LP_7_YM]TDV63481.1 peptidoglycan/LPS O-acetylase OafA/YrhL [Pseudomonas sp. LP_7_YM]